MGAWQNISGAGEEWFPLSKQKRYPGRWTEAVTVKLSQEAGDVCSTDTSEIDFGQPVCTQPHPGQAFSGLRPTSLQKEGKVVKDSMRNVLAWTTGEQMSCVMGVKRWERNYFLTAIGHLWLRFMPYTVWNKAFVNHILYVCMTVINGAIWDMKKSTLIICFVFVSFLGCLK